MTTLLQEYAAAQAERRDDATAVTMRGHRLTYRQLEESSNRLARLLRAAGCRRGDRVCLFVPKSLAAIECMHGALKADCMYVPIDVASPAPRLEKIVRAADPRVVIVAATAAALLDELAARDVFGPSVRIISAEEHPVDGERFRCGFARRDWSGFSPEPLSWANASSDGAHILFTSGSTGAPKGVVVTHGSVIHFVEWARRYFGIAESDRDSGHPPLYFDLSTFDIFGTFSAGAALHLVPPELNLLPHKLAAFIREHELTQWFSVPSILTYMAKYEVVRAGDFPTLRRLLWCGEAIPTRTLVHWMERLPHVTFTNLYGPTEATIASSYFTVRERPSCELEPVPIGTACPGEELLVLDDAMRDVPPGEIGDLYIGGAGLSPGYWRDEEKTAAAFLPDHRNPASGGRLYRSGDLAKVSPEGLTYFVGRADTQIKSRGYRIELGEIEVALSSVPDLAECAVVGVPTGGFEGTAICCAYVPRDSVPLEPVGLRQEIAKALPAYMLPSRWMVFESLPKNANGKVDRGKLRQIFEGARDVA
ncbi:MAG TPA: amino acid adenylation domain-containing protein [Gemmatimonadales bacterium]|nr:amino acid adenylation domain-containing protein [Gemmatimonadales bacterium]